ncbi:MAG: winged helix-turn-helix domain-containing protein [Terracidiphilus sp.]
MVWHTFERTECGKVKAFRFGLFELEPAQQQLRRRGIPLRLPASRIRLLQLLVNRHGELVTRDEIAACLWSEAQTVDVITGINTAVNHLRSQLGDDAAAPRYIETVNGSNLRRISLTDWQSDRFTNPVVSPRGDFIAVTRWYEDDRANIWRIVGRD